MEKRPINSEARKTKFATISGQKLMRTYRGNFSTACKSNRIRIGLRAVLIEGLFVQNLYTSKYFPYLFFARFVLFPYLYFPNCFSKYWLLSVLDILPSVEFRNLGNVFCFSCLEKKEENLENAFR